MGANSFELLLIRTLCKAVISRLIVVNREVGLYDFNYDELMLGLPHDLTIATETIPIGISPLLSQLVFLLIFPND